MLQVNSATKSPTFNHQWYYSELTSSSTLCSPIPLLNIKCCPSFYERLKQIEVRQCPAAMVSVRLLSVSTESAFLYSSAEKKKYRFCHRIQITLHLSCAQVSSDSLPLISVSNSSQQQPCPVWASVHVEMEETREEGSLCWDDIFILWNRKKIIIKISC